MSGSKHEACSEHFLKVVEEALDSLPQEFRITSCFIRRILKQSAPVRLGIREQIRLTVIHELGHYFGMDENQPKDV